MLQHGYFPEASANLKDFSLSWTNHAKLMPGIVGAPQKVVLSTALRCVLAVSNCSKCIDWVQSRQVQDTSVRRKPQSTLIRHTNNGTCHKRAPRHGVWPAMYPHWHAPLPAATYSLSLLRRPMTWACKIPLIQLLSAIYIFILLHL